MSRIEEALRRAAEQEAGTVATEEAAPSPVSDAEARADSRTTAAEATTLAREPFPVEVSDRHVEVNERPVEVNERRVAISERELERRHHPSPDPADPEEQTAREVEQRDGSPSRVFERIDAQLAEKVVADEAMSPMWREQYRKLAAVLHDAQAENGLTVVMIASAVPGEGKSLTSVNLALTLSESYQRRVLLIDADLRKPTLHQLFRLNSSAGLSEGLAAGDGAKLVVRQVSSRLSVLPAGRPTGDPMAALSSPRMRKLITEAKETFDWVILDTPPLVLLPDAHVLSSMVDGVVLVVRANSTPHALVERAADIVGRDSVTGVVLNQAAPDQPSFGAHSHQYYMPMRKGHGH